MYFIAYWTEEEKKIMFDEFKMNLENGILPGIRFCTDVRNKYLVLKKRNPYAMKAWVNNTLRAKKKKTLN